MVRFDFYQTTLSLFRTVIGSVADALTTLLRCAYSSDLHYLRRGDRATRLRQEL